MTTLLPAYEIVDGAGAQSPWLVMVHGASQYRAIFAEQVERFRDDFRILLIDLPGHGASSALPGPYGLEEYAASVAAAIDDAGAAPAHYWGTHTGAAVGLMLAVRHPQRFASLILEAPTLPGVEMPSVTRNIGRARATARDHGIDAARSEWFASAEWFAVMRANPEQCQAAAHAAIIAEFAGGPWLDMAVPKTAAPITNLLRDLTTPVLLINGEHDVPDFVQLAELLQEQLPNVKRCTIAGAGGFPLWEFPQAVAFAVRSFLSAQQP